MAGGGIGWSSKSLRTQTSLEICDSMTHKGASPIPWQRNQRQYNLFPTQSQNQTGLKPKASLHYPFLGWAKHVKVVQKHILPYQEGELL